MLQLTERADVYRMLQVQGQATGKKTMQAVYQNLRCLIIPISQFTGPVPFALEATDIAYLPLWCQVNLEDELRQGRRVDEAGNPVQRRYTVQGVRRPARFGLPVRTAFVKERT